MESISLKGQKHHCSVLHPRWPAAKTGVGHEWLWWLDLCTPLVLDLDELVPFLASTQINATDLLGVAAVTKQQ